MSKVYTRHQRIKNSLFYIANTENTWC